ncbi:hypothetical protein HZB89_01445, partial [archaeon]|nr:hypothetical protein [archaeon]
MKCRTAALIAWLLLFAVYAAAEPTLINKTENAEYYLNEDSTITALIQLKQIKPIYFASYTDKKYAVETTPYSVFKGSTSKSSCITCTTSSSLPTPPCTTETTPSMSFPGKVDWLYVGGDCTNTVGMPTSNPPDA